MTESDTPTPEPAEQDFPLPPASFDYLVFTLRAQAEMQLGLLHFGEEKDRPEPDLRMAQHAIDLMGMLLEKTRGNLSLEEQRYLENSLTELRFRYVQIAEEKKPK
ncbi:MAG: DUF1844 domain-containing protein [Bryobacteraceae bacterium]